ncbi:MAG: 50S ribosomal protein L18 [Candidatus Pacearchaeota archaeon]
MGKRIAIQKRRRREGKTNYAKRLKLLEGRKPRLVVRKTSRYLIAQIVISKEAQDSVVIGVTSKKLADLGWKYSFKNLPACYLTGLLLGKLAKERGIDEAIVDIGLNRATKGNRLFTAAYGASKFLKINLNEKILPVNERIYGRHISHEIEANVKAIENKILTK